MIYGATLLCNKIIFQALTSSMISIWQLSILATPFFIKSSIRPGVATMRWTVGKKTNILLWSWTLLLLNCIAYCFAGDDSKGKNFSSPSFLPIIYIFVQVCIIHNGQWYFQNSIAYSWVFCTFKDIKWL